KHPAIGRQGFDFELTAGPATLRSDAPTMMRVETLEEGAVSVAVLKGEVRVMTASDSAWIRAGERTRVTTTAFVETPRAITLAQRDAFDQWNEEQELLLVRGGYSDEENPDVGQLDPYGEWVSVSTYGRVWRPWVADGWRPYFYGQWLWVSPHGWTWVSAEPWGWLPHHYGQWMWDSFYGWVWVPGSRWAPAWVIWTPYESGWAWAPYGPYGLPVTVLQVSIQLNYWCWTTQLGSGGWQHHRKMSAVPAVSRPLPPAKSPRPPQFQPPRHLPSEGRRLTEQVARLEKKETPRGSFSRLSVSDARPHRPESRITDADRTMGRPDRAQERQASSKRETALAPSVSAPRASPPERRASPPVMPEDEARRSVRRLAPATPTAPMVERERERRQPAERPFVDRGAARPDRPSPPPRQAQVQPERFRGGVGTVPSLLRPVKPAGKPGGQPAGQPRQPNPDRQEDAERSASGNRIRTILR
ncbi:MAG: DUF6600 domain-containing protein, partial [Nitrospirota bacterium]